MPSSTEPCLLSCCPQLHTPRTACVQSEASADAATDSAVTSGNAALSQAAGTASLPPELPTANGHTPSANGLTPAAQKAIPKGQDLATPPGAATLKGVPALPECRVKLVIEADEAAASQVRQAELQHPSSVEAEYRDAEGMYSPEQPFWAVLAGARALSSRESDRRVRMAVASHAAACICMLAGSTILECATLEAGVALHCCSLHA